MMTRNIVVIAGGVLALGALTGSFIFRGEANAKADDADALRKGLPSNACQGGGGGPVCAELDGLQSDRESAASTSNILLGAGIGLAVASVAAFFLWPKPKQQAALGEPPPVGLRGVDVFVEPDRAALGFRGAF